MTLRVNNQPGPEQPYFNDIFPAKEYVTGEYYATTFPFDTINVSTSIAADTIFFCPFVPFVDLDITEIGVNNSGTGDNGKNIRMGVYEPEITTAPIYPSNPSTLLDETAEITLDGTAASRIGSISVSMTAGLQYWLAIACDTAITMVEAENLTRFHNTRGPRQPAELAADFLTLQTIQSSWTYSSGGLPATTGALTFPGFNSSPLLFVGR